jgi:NhaA family Na+:H+ antiporter
MDYKPSRLGRLMSHEAAPGVLLMIAAALAMILANSEVGHIYQAFFDQTLSITLGGIGLSKPLILWINDGLMAIFFFLIGLELKREMLEGRLNKPSEVILPGVAAVGGMLVPVAVFLLFTRSDPTASQGWAIPAATDIAFAVGVLALLGKRIPSALKIFLLTLAILDDLGAIMIIALFYGKGLQVEYLIMALLPLAALAYLNWRGTHRIAPFVLFAVILWVLVLKSGIHATIAGVVAAFFLPLKDKFGKSPLHAVEHGLHPYVMLMIAPLFALGNAGVVLSGMQISDLFAPLPLGIMLGLFVGKQLGVFGATFLVVKSGLARLPEGVTWPMIYGLSCLAGIGFTMSLFIGSLSFDDQSLMNSVRLGVLAGSILSATLGFVVLQRAAKGVDVQPGVDATGR